MSKRKAGAKFDFKWVIILLVVIAVLSISLFVFLKEKNRSHQESIANSNEPKLEATVSALIALANSNLQKAGKLSSKQNLSAQEKQEILMLTQGAISNVRDAVEAQSDKAETWYQMSKVYQQLIGFGENADQFAELSLQRAIQIEPNNASLYFALGQLYIQLKKYDQAEVALKKAIAINPKEANYYYNLGYAYAQGGNTSEARNAYLEAKKRMDLLDKNQKVLDDALRNLQ